MTTLITNTIILLIIIAFIIASASGCSVMKAASIINSGESIIHNGTESQVSIISKGHLIIVKVYLNDFPKPYNFILDTGALTVIDRNIVQELKLTDGVKVKGSGAGGNSEPVQLVQIDKLKVGNAEVNNFGSAVYDFSSKFGSQIDGILGSNFLKQFKVTIDYQNNQITLSNEIKPQAVKNSEFIIPFKVDMKNGFAPQIKCILNDEIKSIGIIDTGSPSIADLPVSIIKRMRKHKEGKVITSIGGMSGGMFGMSEENYLLRINKFQVDNLIIDNITSISHSMEGDKILIGKKFLSNFVVTLNYPANEMTLKPIKENFDTNINSYGLAFTKENGKTLISGIWKNSPAYNCGLKTRYEIIEINSIPTKNLSLLELMAILQDESRNTIKIVYINNGVNKEIILDKTNLSSLLD